VYKGKTNKPTAIFATPVREYLFEFVSPLFKMNIVVLTFLLHSYSLPLIGGTISPDESEEETFPFDGPGKPWKDFVFYSLSNVSVAIRYPFFFLWFSSLTLMYFDVSE